MTDAAAALKSAPIPLVLPPSGFTDPTAAFKPFPLANAVTVDGRSYGAIYIRRFTVAQVQAISENYRANLALDPAATMTMPIYCDEAGADLPPAVLGLITPDESDDLDEVTADFLPRRFRVERTAATPDGSSPEDGSTTAPSS